MKAMMVIATSVIMTMHASVMGPTLSSKKPTCQETFTHTQQQQHANSHGRCLNQVRKGLIPISLTVVSKHSLQTDSHHYILHFYNAGRPAWQQKGVVHRVLRCGLLRAHRTE